MVIGVAAATVYALSEMRLSQRISAPIDRVSVPTDLPSIQHGQHLASAVALCVDCHRPNLGGRVVLDSPTIGRIVAPNLTRGQGGAGTSLSNDDFVRAIRYGVAPTGRRLEIMPSDAFNNFSDADLGAIIAYVRALPPISSNLPPNEIRPLGRLLFVTGQLLLLPSVEIDPTAPRPPAPLPELSAEYGQYLINSAGCPTCHGPGLSGGRIPGGAPDAVPATNLTPAGLGGWSQADFVRAMRTGRRPDDSLLDASMPWPYYAQMTDTELGAIWQFLEAVPPRGNGTR